MEEDVPHDDEHADIRGDDAEVLSNSQVASDGDEGPGCSPIRNTLSGVSQVFGAHEETDVESDYKVKTPPVWQKRRSPSPKEGTSSKESEESSSKEEQPTDEALHNKAWQRVQHMDTNFDAWWHKKIAKGLPGWVARDTMICDLPRHGKVQPNHPDPVGPPLDYMCECQVFKGVYMQCISLNGLHTLLSKGTFMPLQSNTPPQTEQDDDHSTCVKGRQLAKEDYQCLRGTPGLQSQFLPIQPQPNQRLHPGHRCGPPGGMQCSQGWA